MDSTILDVAVNGIASCSPATHKPLCNVCLHCDVVLTKIKRCSRFPKTKYCGAECSRAHWSEHKNDCVVRSSK